MTQVIEGKGINELEEEIKRLFKEFVELCKTEEKVHGEKKRVLQQLGAGMEEICIRRKQYDEIKFTASTLASWMRGEKLSESDIIWMYRVLPKRYKNRNLSLNHLRIAGKKETEESIYHFNEIKEHINALRNIDYESLTREQVAKIRDLVDDPVHDVDIVCKQADIATVSTGAAADYLVDRFSEKIIFQPGKPTKPEHEQLKAFAKENYEIQRNVFNIREKLLDSHSPQTTEEWIHLLNGQLAFIMMFKPLTDKKWQRHWLDWATISKNYKDQGGTYASSKSKVETYELDKKGKPIMRQITKEQIDATLVPKVNSFVFMTKFFPYCIEEMAKFNYTELGSRATRAVQMHDKLSEAA